MPGDKALRSTAITRIISGAAVPQDDLVAVEEPLEIRVAGQPIAVVMRTPGHDRELAAGFLVTEGVLRRRDDVLDLIYCDADGGVPDPNILDVILGSGAKVDLKRLTRHVFTSSSCGICSKATVAAVQAQFPAIIPPPPPSRQLIAALPARARAAQRGFAATGGLHASALFSLDTELIALREDVGRHNALDKLIGYAFLETRLPLADRILLVSGRVSFEIMQKAFAAGIPCVAAISAPTSAAVEFARSSGQTLIGFLRGGGDSGDPDRMNVYAGTVG